MKEPLGTNGLILNEPFLWERGKREDPDFLCLIRMLSLLLWMKN